MAKEPVRPPHEGLERRVREHQMMEEIFGPVEDIKLTRDLRGKKIVFTGRYSHDSRKGLSVKVDLHEVVGDELNPVGTLQFSELQWERYKGIGDPAVMKYGLPAGKMHFTPPQWVEFKQAGDQALQDYADFLAKFPPISSSKRR